MAFINLKLVAIFLLLAGLGVDCGPFKVPGFESDVSVDDLVQAANGDRNIKVEIGNDGVRIYGDYTPQQKLLIGAVCIVGLFAVLGCCACLCLCCRQSRPASTNIVYQNMPTGGHPVSGYHQPNLPPIPEGRSMPQQPPPYSTNGFANGKH